MDNGRNGKHNLTDDNAENTEGDKNTTQPYSNSEDNIDNIVSDKFDQKQVSTETDSALGNSTGDKTVEPQRVTDSVDVIETEKLQTAGDQDSLEAPTGLETQNTNNRGEPSSDNLRKDTDNQDENSEEKETEPLDTQNTEEEEETESLDTQNSQEATHCDSYLRKIVDEEIRKQLEKINRKQLERTNRKQMMQSTITAAVAFFFGIGCMYFGPSNIQNTIVPVAVGPGNITYYQPSKDINNMKTELLQCQANVTKLQDDFLFLKRDLNIVNGTIEIQEYKYINGVVLLTIFGIIEGLVIVLVFKHCISDRQRKNSGQTGEQYHNQEPTIPQSARSSNILDRVSRVPLEMSVGIVSFYEETQTLHQSLVKSAIQPNIPIKMFMMRNPETEIKHIPTSKFIFVFVDFNERNVILENPGQDLGDKKVVTVQAAQKIGADVFVVYVRDRGSIGLRGGDLYNSELSSFTKHLVLKEVTRRDRGLSVYETFTDYQKRHISNVIDGNFQRQ